MQTKFYSALILIMCFTICKNSNAQSSANKTLSNLNSPTSVNESLMPDKDDKHNLGSNNKSWKDLYFSGSVYVNGSKFISNPVEENTYVGYFTNGPNSTGTNNTAVGFESLYSNTSGYGNTAYGEGSLFLNQNGYDNTACGIVAGHNIKSGSFNTFVGYSATCGSTGAGNNMTAIGNSALVTASNHVVVGNSSVTSIGGYVNWSNFSDGRYKKNIKQNVPGLEFINMLQPITYTLDVSSIETKLHEGIKLDSTDKHSAAVNNILKLAMDEKSKIIYTGFVAQDVEAAAKNLNYDFSGVDKPKDDNHSFYGLRYGDFVVPLVKAVQELSKQNDSLKNENLIQQKVNVGLEERITKLESIMNALQSTTNDKAQTTHFVDALLQQNIPNPFSNTTAINYSLPNQFTSARIIITDKNGKALKQINLSGNKGNISIDAATLSSGAYQYSLYADGKLIGSKQMIVSK